MAIVWAIILAHRHRVQSLRLIDGRVPVDASSGCPVIGRAVETGEIGTLNGGPGAGWGRHAPLD